MEKEEIIKSEIAQKEEKILEFWDENQIFKKTLDKESPNGNFVFFDGPPFATGLPHYGHVLPGTIKDIIPRYQTMNGKKVLRRWGWDCHGLPIENLVEKELSLSSKKDIEGYGLQRFNKYANSIVFRYADEWKKIIPRVSRWVDMEDDYRTMDPSYTESVWWSFKTLYDKGLIYQGFKSMLLCPRCETTLSNFEVNQGYKDITDISVTVKLELVDNPGTFLLAWTTTPWTLPGNVALAVGKDIDYVRVINEYFDDDDNSNKKQVFICSTKYFDLIGEDYFKNKKSNHPSLTSTEFIKGKDLIGLKYKPLFDYYNNEKTENKENSWKVYAGDFVTSEDGTGIVHIAPAFGEDDMNLGKENNLPFIQHVNRDGTFKSEVSDFAGLKVKPKEDHQQTDIEIIKHLAHKGLLFSKEKIVHSYPHCWRCSTPLLNYATTSWFLKVTALKNRMLEVNKNISWIPSDIKDGRFGKWLEGARDWAISRSRYWGAPLPVWEKENGDKVVVGSIEDLKKYIGKKNNIFLMRHGGSESNQKQIICSNINTEDHLTEKGKEQTIISSKKLGKIDLIVSSPFIRTKETAEIIANEIGINPNEIIFDDRLGEISAIKYDNKSWLDFDLRKTNENIENLDSVRRRTMQVLYELDEKYQGKNILIMSHGGPVNIMRLASQGLSQKEIIKHFYESPFKNSVFVESDFVSLPHDEKYDIDLHRPYIDDVILKDEKGNPMKRISEVFDCWYESGSMPFAQVHYPFENKDEFEKKDSSLFPAEFIAEGLDQTRGWFYTLLTLSVGLFDKAPYKHVVVNGLVLAEDGRKMSKSLNNYPDPIDIVNKYGADALRYYLVSSPLVKAEDFNFSEKGVDEIYKKFIQKTYNVVSFYEMYPVEKEGQLKETLLDKWILSRLDELTKVITNSLDRYELDKASRPILDFVDDLSTWYLRRSRDRFKSDDDNVRYSASYYLALVLKKFSILIAPFTPFMSEEIYRRVNGEKDSVHLESWPKFNDFDLEIIENMKKVREVVTSALELRQKVGIKVRQPLNQLKIKSGNFENELLNIIADEVNVKEVLFDNSLSQEVWLDTELSLELKREGIARDIIRSIQDVRKNESLIPGDKIKLVVNCSDEIKSIISSFEKMIKIPTQTTEISYSSEKQKYPIEILNEDLTVSIIM